jgi:ABC-2 type transport system permease protein
MTQVADRAQRSASQPVVALVTDSQTAEALQAARARLARGSSELTFPVLRVVQPAENVPEQARALLADQAGGYSAVLSGTLEHPILTGPTKIDENVTTDVELIIDVARRLAALDVTEDAPPAAQVERVLTQEAAGSLQMIRHGLARGVMSAIFGISILLSTLMLSNLVEEKSNKVIEVLAAAISLDSVFYGKLIAVLGISLIGLLVWGGTFGLAYLFVQLVQDWVTLPQAGPAVGWPIFIGLALAYYITNFMLLGALSLGVGAQASNIRDVQTLTLPMSLVPVTTYLLALMVVGRGFDFLATAAYIFPLSSPLAMIGFAAQYDTLWIHAAALVWQTFWVVAIVRLSSRLFKKTVLKSSQSGSSFGPGVWSGGDAA